MVGRFRPFHCLHLLLKGNQTTRKGNKCLFPFLSLLLSFLYSPGNWLSAVQERKVPENRNSTDQLDTAYIAVLPKTGLRQAHLSEAQKGRPMIDEQRSCTGKVKKQQKTPWKARKKEDQSKKNTLGTKYRQDLNVFWALRIAARSRVTRIKANENSSIDPCFLFAFVFLKRY